MHQRLVKFDGMFNGNRLPKVDKELEVILFYWDELLRSHAVSHFANLTEIQDWKKIGSIDTHRLTASIDGMKDIGCPYFTEALDRPPCRSNNKKCRKWKQCTPYVTYIENNYEACCRKLMEESCQVPRLAGFKNNAGQENFWVLANYKIVALCSFIGSRYTMKTCYRPKQGVSVTWYEIRDFIIKKIQFESRGEIHWISKQTWGIEDESHGKSYGEKRFGKDKDGGKNKWKRRARRRRR